MATFTPFSVRLKNYRSFAVPTEIQLRPGMTSFVGPNNGGKSNVLRFVYELRSLFQSLAHPANMSPSLYQAFNTGANFSPTILNGVPDFLSVFSNQNEEPLTIEISRSDGGAVLGPSMSEPGVSRIIPTAILIRIERSGSLNIGLRHGTSDTAASQFTRAGAAVRVDHLRGIEFDLAPYVESFALLSDSLYIGSFRNVINQGASKSYFDLTIGTALIEAWGSYQAGVSQREAHVAASVIQELENTFDFGRLELVATNDKSNIRAFVEREPYFLTELGSGVSQFFMTILNLEMKHNRLVMIDEPELGLHPQLQTDFLDAVARRSEAVLFTTHSLGLARTMGDAIYTVARTGPKGSSVLREFNALNSPLELLGELSYAGNCDLGFKKILLVEGPTEIKLFRVLLQKAGLSHRITILSLGGSSSINPKAAHALADIRRLSDEVFAIVDSERTSEKQRALPERLKFEKNCKRIGIHCHLLERRSIEAYFSEHAIKSVAGEHYSTVGPLEKIPANWPKQLNWRIVEAMDMSEFTGTDLHGFIEQITAVR